MHFSLSTIAAAALAFAAVEAIPHGTGSSSGVAKPSSGFGFASGAAAPSGGKPRHSGVFGSGIAAPSGDPPSGLVSVAFPGETPAAALRARAHLRERKTSSKSSSSDDDEDEDAAETTTKKSSTKTSAASDEEATSSAKSTKTSSSSKTKTSASTSSSTGSSSSSSSSGSSSSNSTSSSGGTTASSTFPTAAGESTLSEPMSVTGEFDGGMVRFGRGTSCTGQEEGGDSDAVFQIEEGGTLKNVIIGADQSEGVHCMGACTIENVYWEAVCEDALTIKQTSGTSYVIGGGAKGAEDKVIQHNGGGTVSISGFYVSDFGKLYRSCGNCDTMYERHVIVDGVIADSGSILTGINSNYGDTSTITNTCATSVDTICEEFEGNDTGEEPSSISSGPSSACIYTDSDVAAC